MASLDGGFAAWPFGMNRDIARPARNAGSLVAFEDRDTFLSDRVHRQGRMGFVRTGERATHLEHRDLRAKAAEGLRQLQADRTAAKDDQVLGKLRHREDRLV